MTLHYALMVEKTGVDVAVAVFYAGDEIAGFFTFQFRSVVDRFLGRAERVGGEMSDYCGAILAPDFFLDELELLRLSRIHCYDFSHLHPDQLQNELPVDDFDVGHLVRISSSGTDYWRELGVGNGRLIQDTNRCLGKIQREIGPISFRFEVLNRPDLLDYLIQMKRDQYTKTQVSDALSERWRRDLLHALYVEKSGDCRGVLSTLYAGNEMVAAHFGMVAGVTLHYWFPVYEPRFSKYSPGRLLYKHIVEACDDNGVKVIDNGAGDAPYKSDLSNCSYKIYSGQWRRRTPLAILSAAKSSIQWRIDRYLSNT